MAKHGKSYLNLKEKIDKEIYYELEDALRFLKENAFVKFDETVEISMRLGVDPRHSDQMVRGTVVLPHGTGKKVRVLVFATGEKVLEAKEAGDEEAHQYDEDYIHALEYALPPTVGVGVGIDRLTMFLTNTTSIKDVILFPTMKRIEE